MAERSRRPRALLPLAVSCLPPTCVDFPRREKMKKVHAVVGDVWRAHPVTVFPERREPIEPYRDPSENIMCTNLPSAKRIFTSHPP